MKNNANSLIHRVADPDPGSGAFFTPAYGIGFSRISDPQQQTANFPPSLLLVVESGINIPDLQHCYYSIVTDANLTLNPDYQ
jgi:hypothetical protein